MNARLTTTQLINALDPADQKGAKTLFRLLKRKGLVKEVARISYKGKGRKIVLYEMPKKIEIKVPARKMIPEATFLEVAFRAERQGWCQSDVARELGVTSAAVSLRLKSLRKRGVKTPDISSNSGWVLDRNRGRRTVNNT